MAYTVQIDDPDGMQVTLAIPGKYNPDILDDATARLTKAYREALITRAAVVKRMEQDTLAEDSEDES